MYSITNYKVNSTITIKIQQSVQLLWQYKQQDILNKLKKKLQTLGMKNTYLNNVLISRLYLNYKNTPKQKT